MSEDWRTYSRALRRLLSSTELREGLAESQTRQETESELGVTQDMGNELRATIMALNASSGGSVGPADAGTIDAQAREVGDSARQFLDRSIRHLTHGSYLLIGMSVVLFLVGIGFLLLAAVRSFTDPDSVEATAVVGGIGIVQIVALFYRHPLREIGRAISNAQQANIIVLSYMLGVGLVGRRLTSDPNADQHDTLSRLTSEALERLERYTEEVRPGSDAKQAPAANRAEGAYEQGTNDTESKTAAAIAKEASAGQGGAPR